MLRKHHFFLFIFLLSAIFSLTNTFAAENGDPLDIDDIERIIAEGNVAFPTADGPDYIQGNAEYQRTPDFIIGSRDFEKMRDLPTDSQDYQLGRKVGLIFIQDPSGGSFICTGFLVGPDLFMTNHHCLYGEFGPRPLETARIFMDFYQDRDVDRTLGGVTARVSELLRADAEKDYALLRLDTPIGETYGWLEFDTTTRTNPNQSVKIIQHPRGRSKEIVRRNSKIIDIPAGHPLFDVPAALAYFADTEGGSSGSPVFLREGTGVIAIHHSGWRRQVTGVPIHNAGTLMSHIVPEIQQYLPTEPPTVDEPPYYVYWIDAGNDTIQRAHPDGANVQDIVTTGLRTPTNISLDMNENKVYWTDSRNDSIGRANLDGTNPEDIITRGLRTPTDVALDTFYGNIYWADTGTDTIGRANFDGSNIQDIVTTGLRTPKAIALDAYGPHSGKVYWIDAGTDKIGRANLDGSNIEDIITTGLRTPTDIALDLVNGKVYWSDSGTDKIGRANLDGSNVEDVVTTGLRTPTGIALDVEGGKVYWIDSGTDTIGRANLDGTNIEEIVTTGLRTPTGIALGIPQITSTTPPGPGPGSLDVNGDGQVTVMDLVAVALFYGTQVPAGIGSLPADVNADGVVNVLDLTAVAQGIDADSNGNGVSLQVLKAAAEQAAEIEVVAEAPMRFGDQHLTYNNVAEALGDVRHLATGDVRLAKSVTVLEVLLHLLSERAAIPEQIALLPNYPNPFNPETWIPYHLSKESEVTVTIHDIRGILVRELALGHQAAGIYESRARAAYWDGKNSVGEKVASGVYFYTLAAGDFTATRKLLIAK